MTMFDATKLTSEDDLSETDETDENEAEESLDEDSTDPLAAEVQLLPVRILTLALPAECETAVKILVRRDVDGYRWGYEIKRAYDSLPHETESDPMSLDDDCDPSETLEDAIKDAANKAAWWFTQHSDDNDEKARAALTWLDEWLFDFNAEAATDDIFDPLPTAAETIKAEKKAEEKLLVVAAGCSGVTKEAQDHFDTRRHFLEERSGKLAIEQLRLVDAAKYNKECIRENTEELRDLLARGPDRLPLFDRAKTETAEKQGDLFDGKQGATVAAVVKPAAAVIDPVAADDESWRAVSVQDAGILPALCKVLNQDNQIYNLGQLADVTKKPNTALTDLKKVGKAKAEKIEEALVAYWETHPRTDGV